MTEKMKVQVHEGTRSRQKSTYFGVVKHLLHDYLSDPIEEVYKLLTLLINCYWLLSNINNGIIREDVKIHNCWLQPKCCSLQDQFLAFPI